MHPTPNTQPPTPDPRLSPSACELLDYLRRFAASRERARTDAAIAEALHLPARQIIDLADELLAAGHIVVAEVKAPMGRWLCTGGAAELAHARHYADSLQDRGVSILSRRKHLVAAIEKAEARRLVDSTGQHRLF